MRSLLGISTIACGNDNLDRQVTGAKAGAGVDPGLSLCQSINSFWYSSTLRRSNEGVGRV